jgi:CBS domain-containing protein
MTNNNNQEHVRKEEFKVSGEDIIKKVKELIKEGNVRRIIIKNEEGKILMEIPVTFAVVGAVIAPILAAVGALAGILTNCTIVVERRE